MSTMTNEDAANWILLCQPIPDENEDTQPARTALQMGAAALRENAGLRDRWNSLREFILDTANDRFVGYRGILDEMDRLEGE